MTIKDLPFTVIVYVFMQILALLCTAKYCQILMKQGVALMGRNRTGPPCSCRSLPV